MDSITLGLAAVSAALIYIYTRKQDKLSPLPGPFRIPIFGNVQFNFKRLHMQFTEFAHQFGGIYRIQILSQPCIVINSYEAFNEAYIKNNKDFGGRPKMLRFEVMGAVAGIGFRVSFIDISIS